MASAQSGSRRMSRINPSERGDLVICGSQAAQQGRSFVPSRPLRRLAKPAYVAAT